MTVRYDGAFLRQLKKLGVRVRKSFKEKITIFVSDPFNPQLDNHTLREKFEGYRSIDITNDYRALYQEKSEGDEKVAFFVVIGTHDELYKNNKSTSPQ